MLKGRLWIGTSRGTGKEEGLNRHGGDRVYNEALEEGKSWGEVKELARNRVRMRRFVEVICP
jgi:hypothetical protein